MTTTKICTVADCTRPARAKGLCTMHYRRLTNHGSTDKPVRPQPLLSKAEIKQRPLTVERLRERLHYDPVTGRFTHRFIDSRPGCKSRGIGESAGTPNDQGYIVTRLDYNPYKAHRLAWLYVYGAWPAGDIDHINGNRADNRIENLRDVPRTTNCENRTVAAGNSLTGFLGVVVRPAGGRNRTTRYVAQITTKGKRTYIGAFGTPEEAHAAYLRVKEIKHEGFAR